MSGPYRPGQVLASRRKGAAVWIARISSDRSRLEVIARVEPSTTPTEIEALTEIELLELLGQPTDLHADDAGGSCDPAPERVNGLAGFGRVRGPHGGGWQEPGAVDGR